MINSSSVNTKQHVVHYTRTPFIRTPVFRIANYSDRLGLCGEFVKNSKNTNLLWNCRLWDQVQHSIMASRIWNQARSESLHAGARCNNNSWTSNCQISQFSEKNPIIRIFCVSGRLAVPINSDKWSSTMLLRVKEECNILQTLKRKITWLATFCSGTAF